MNKYETIYIRNGLQFKHVWIYAASWEDAEIILHGLKQSKYWSTWININSWQITGKIIPTYNSGKKINDRDFSKIQRYILAAN
jgi:hypothetical protein